jgi:formylglycine-generating enzyme required for sulfatase activity
MSKSVSPRAPIAYLRAVIRIAHRVVLLALIGPLAGCRGHQTSDAIATDSANALDAEQAEASLVQSDGFASDANLDAPWDGFTDSGDARAASCLDGMALIPGGVTWMGTDFDVDEAPRHQMAVRSFCMDLTEVTVAAYQACVHAGKCVETHKGPGCTAWVKQDLSKHPVNCVDWEQADAACKAWGKRLPTEREWEFAASGGPEHRRFSWGGEDPQGRSCYNKPSTCPVGSYAAGAFGLHDMSGDVWEWTASWFGLYPEEASSGRFRIYRGGSYSRRFPRWMRTGLRNRFSPNEYGAHLGFRCSTDLSGSACPEGSNPTPTGCEVPGQKKSAPRPSDWGSVPAGSGSASAPPPAEPPVVSRDPRYDDDCKKYKPGRPVCYLGSGGSFAERQKIGSARGCVNRDVGVGFNSYCCPQ